MKKRSDNLELIGFSELEILKSQCFRSGFYYLIVHAPTWGLDKFRPEACWTFVVLKDSNNQTVLRAHGIGTSEFQSIAYSFGAIRKKMLENFAPGDRFRLSGKRQQVNLETALEALFEHDFTGIARDSTKLGKRITDSVIITAVGNESKIELAMTVHKPRKVRNRWTCAAQLENGKLLVWDSIDSFRALTGAFSLMKSYLRRQFLDSSWNFEYLEDGEKHPCNLDDVLAIFYGVNENGSIFTFPSKRHP